MVYKPKNQEQVQNKTLEARLEEDEKAETEELLRKAVNAKDESFSMSKNQTPVKETLPIEQPKPVTRFDTQIKTEAP